MCPSTKLSEDEFDPIESEEITKKVKTKAVKKTVTSHIQAQLDLRGTRFEEAQKQLDDYLDQALLANLHQITVVHIAGISDKMVSHFQYRMVICILCQAFLQP